MKVKLKDLWRSGGSIERLADIEFTEEKLNYKVGRIHRAVAAELEPLRKSYMRLLRKHGEEAKDGEGKSTGHFIIPSGTDKEEAFDAEWNEILDAEAEFWGDPINLDQIKEYMGKIKAKDLGALDWLITE